MGWINIATTHARYHRDIGCKYNNFIKVKKLAEEIFHSRPLLILPSMFSLTTYGGERDVTL